MKLEKRGVVWLLVSLFFLVLIGLSMAQTSQSGCFTEPSYVNNWGKCQVETPTNALSLCNNDQTCYNNYFYPGQSCSNVQICQATSGGWCTDTCQQAASTRPAECPDRSKFVLTSTRPSICDPGCCICSATGQSNVCSDSGGLWSAITLQDCNQKCGALTSYFVGHFNTTATASECQTMCNTFTPSPATLSGTVFDKSNNALAGASVSAAGQATTTDGSGSYTLNNLPSGQVIIVASLSGFGTNRTTLTLPAGGSVSQTLTLPAAGQGTVKGKVTSGGNPVANVLVYTTGQSYAQDYTNASGDYEINLLPFGNYNITATKTGYIPANQTFSLSSSSLSATANFNIVLRPQGFIYGLVKDLNTGSPLSQAQVWVDGNLETLTDSSNNFNFNVSVFANSTGVNHSVFIDKPGYSQSRTQYIFVRRNENKQTNDYNLVSTRTACSYPANLSVNSFSANPVPGTKAVRLSWSNPCNQITGFYINKSVGLGSLKTESFLTYIDVVDARNIPTSFTDTNVNWNTNYEYKIWAAYDDVDFRLSPAVTATILTGNSTCEGKYKNNVFTEFCVGQLRKVCNGQNQVTTVRDCSNSLGSNAYCWGPDLAGKTTCRLAACSSGNPWFPLSRSQCYGSNNFCYYDVVLSTTSLCYSCSRITDCYDYNSQDACLTNSCLGQTCNWIPSQLAGVGWCTEQSYSKTDHCGDCSATGGISKNDFCTPTICSALGACYSKTYSTATGTHQWCTDCNSQSKCSEFTNQSECEGNQIRQFSSVPGQIVPSDDICGLGTCKWDGNRNVPCFKDGDLDGNAECITKTKVPSSKQGACEIDNTAPVTSISPIGYIGVGGNQGKITFSAADTNAVTMVSYCVDTTNTCIPDVNLTYTSSKFVDETLYNSSSLLQAYVPGRTKYYLRYRSIDEFYNLENVQSRGIYVDQSGPQIILSYTKTEKTSGGSGASDLDFTIVTTESANCSDSLVQVGGSTRNGIDASAVQDSWKVTYANLPDGLYNYFITCTDAVGNADTANITGIIIDAVKSIQVLQPPSATNQYKLVFDLQTQNLANCKLYEGSTFKETLINTSPPAPQRHTSNTYTFTNDGYYERWRADCQFAGQSDTVRIPFTIDHQPPVTSVEMSSKGTTQTKSGNFSINFNDDVGVAFRCNDQPPHGFGCQETKWCLTSLGGTCAPQSTANVPTITSSKSLCYYSTDTDNNVESNHCADIALQPGVGAKVKDPSNGVSALTNFNLTIETDLATDLCKFGFDRTVNFTRLQDPRNYFTKINNYEHLSNYSGNSFTQNPLITARGFPTNPTTLTLFVVCNLTTGEISAVEPITLAYDSSAPTITVSTDPGSPIASGNSVDLVVNADDQVRCKYSTSTNSYSAMQGKFPGFNTPNFNTENRQAVAVNNQGQFTYYIGCENKAELTSTVQTLTYTVDFTASGIISRTAPNGSTNNQSVTLEVWTNKDGSCTYTYSGSSTSFSKTGQLYHASGLTGLSEGRYRIPVSCRFSASGKTASDKIDFNVDLTAPRITRVNDGTFSCGLDEINVLFEATDNLSSVSEFEYSLLKTGSTDSLANGTVTAANAEITGLNLTEGEDYFVKARAKDSAGNWETSFTSGDGFLATYANRTECQDTGPPSLSFTKNTTADGVKVSLICNDETGCERIYYGTAIDAEDCSPTLTYQNIPILLSATSYVCAEAKDIIGNQANLSVRIWVGDEDGDGVHDSVDQCPNTRAGAIVDENGCSNRQLKIDTDHDRLPDWWEIRYDAVGCLLNYQEEDSDFNDVTDDLEDFNNNGIDNYEEYLAGDDPCIVEDTDNDGVPDHTDNCDNTPVAEINEIVTDKNSSNYGCSPSEIFSLGDGIDDGWRLRYFGCIDCPEAAADYDYDGDGLTNLEEYDLKGLYGRSTDPTNIDTDNDGYSDLKEYNEGWDPLDASSPARKSSILLPIIFLILGWVLVLGGIAYLIIFKLKVKKPKAAARPVAPVRPAARPIYRPRPRPTPRRKSDYEELVARRKAELEKERREEREKVFGVFGGGKKELPKLTKIVTKKDSVFDKLTDATHHYMKQKEKVAPKLTKGEKNIFDEMTRKIGKPTKEAVRKHLRKKSDKERRNIFNKLVDIVGKHSGNSFEKLKKYGKKK